MQCSMLDDFHQPSVVDGIEESTDVRVEYPVLCQNSAVPSIYSSARPELDSSPVWVLPSLSVDEMTLRLYGALNYSQNRAHDLRYVLNGA